MHAASVDPNSSAAASDRVSVFRSNKQFEADMIVAALEEAGIPCYQSVQGRVSDGLISASAVDHVGSFCCVYVPRGAAEEALRVVLAFPFVEESKEQEPVEPPPPIRLSRTALLIILAALVLIISLAIGL